MSEKTKRKHYYVNDFRKKQKLYTLSAGMKGFICSCNNNKEKECIREAYNILNKYFDQIQAKEDDKEVDKSAQKVSEIEDCLQNELEAMKSKTISPQSKRFQVVDSGAKNFLFVQTTIDNPLELAEKIISDIAHSKQQQTRFLIRLVPIEVTCKAYIDDITKSFEVLLHKYFNDEPKSFSVVYNHRNNNNLLKDDVVQVIAHMVLNIQKGHSVNLKNPDIFIVVEVIKGIALMAAISTYMTYKKYNLQALCDTDCKKNLIEKKISENVIGKVPEKELNIQEESKEASKENVQTRTFEQKGADQMLSI